VVAGSLVVSPRRRRFSGMAAYVIVETDITDPAR